MKTPKALFLDLDEIETHAGRINSHRASLYRLVTLGTAPNMHISKSWTPLLIVVCSHCLLEGKIQESQLSFTMRLLSLFQLCLLLGQLTVLSGVIFAASVHHRTIRAELARSHQTTEKDTASRFFLSLQQRRSHHANTLDSLHRRRDDMYVLNDGWLMRLLRIDSGLPISIASALLEDFYERVLERVHGFAPTIRPLKAVSLCILDLHLDFMCDSAEVSWDFIIAFVRAMLDATKRGFTGKFQAVVFHGPTQTAVYVALRILGPADPNDSTDTDTRFRVR